MKLLMIYFVFLLALISADPISHKQKRGIFDLGQNAINYPPPPPNNGWISTGLLGWLGSKLANKFGNPPPPPIGFLQPPFGFPAGFPSPSIGFPIVKHIAIPVQVPISVPIPIDRPVAVYVPHPVPVPVIKHVGIPVPVPHKPLPFYKPFFPNDPWLIC